jgi:hypothetical protein
MPKIPDTMLDVVFYLYPSEEDARIGKNIGGTGFIVVVPSETVPEQGYYYGVTNWHVACRDGCSTVRLNTLSGTQDIFPFEPHEWTFDPRFDIAVIPLAINKDKHRCSTVERRAFLTLEQIREFRVGVGDDVFMLGRFMDYDGVQTNRPTARFGHISLMPSPILQPTTQYADSYCVDLHSRTGYSGSPAFVYRTSVGDLEADGLENAGRSGHRRAAFLAFLGILWGQFPEFWRIKDGDVVIQESNESGNLVTAGQYVKGLSGMSCVLPAACIAELLDLPKFKENRVRMDKLILQKAQKHGRVAPEPVNDMSYSFGNFNRW